MCLDKLPGVAEVAMQSGLYAGRKIGHEARGQAFDQPFRYRDLGSAAYISRGRAVVSAFKMNFGGFLGWWVWLFIHIGFLTGYRNRVGAVLGWWFAFTRDLRRERTFTVDDMPLRAGAYGDSSADPALAKARGVSLDAGQPAAALKAPAESPSAAITRGRDTQ
jgi:NADH dehydrogenase